MPEMDGFRIADQIKNNSSFNETEVVMLTSVGLHGDAAKCREIGISAHVNKPIKRSGLFNIIKVALGSRDPDQDTHALVMAYSLRESRTTLTNSIGGGQSRESNRSYPPFGKERAHCGPGGNR